jgi:phytoene synthase
MTNNLNLPDEIYHLFEKGSTTYFNSSLFFPDHIRSNVFRLYAFVRTADNFVDHLPQKRKQFRTFKEEYLRARQTQTPSSDVVINEFVKLEAELQFNHLWTDAFLHSMEMDLERITYDTLEDTLQYIYGSAEVIGLYMATIMNLPAESFPTAKLLGRAMQYINFIRDIKEDLHLGRVYFPQEEVQQCGLSELSEAEARAKPDQFKQFIQQQITRYKAWQQEAEVGFRFIPKSYLVPIKTASDCYAWTARQIEKNPLIVFQKKIKPHKAQVALTAMKNMAIL